MIILIVLRNRFNVIWEITTYNNNWSSCRISLINIHQFKGASSVTKLRLLKGKDCHRKCFTGTKAIIALVIPHINYQILSKVRGQSSASLVQYRLLERSMKKYHWARSLLTKLRLLAANQTYAWVINWISLPPMRRRKSWAMWNQSQVWDRTQESQLHSIIFHQCHQHQQ